MRRIVMAGVIVLVALTTKSYGTEAQIVDVWPGKAPGDAGPIAEEKVVKKNGDGKIVSVTNVSRPTLSIFRPDKEKDTGVAIVVCPGGGYNNLAWDHEGEQVATWLNSLGVTAAVLKYRVPRRPETTKDMPPPQALMDAQRALSLVRSKAMEWGVNPKRVGMLGFSAGGHLTGWAATNYDKRAYEPLDTIDTVSCRPDFAVLIYPGGVVAKGTLELKPEIRITKETPPMFFVHASNDSVENSVAMYLAARRAGVSTELHLYATGGHGFGMRPGPHPSATWSQRCTDWLRDQGVLAGKKES
jgi:acetyl esterase/lipase